MLKRSLDLIRSGLLGLLALGLAGALQAATIYSGTLTLSASDPTQLGRMTRDGVASDWSFQKSFPDVFNAGVNHHYQTLTLDLDLLQAGFSGKGDYYQISIDSTVTTTFLSAYLDVYDPNNQALNYLGDAGSSGNYFGIDPRYFQIMAPLGHDLVLVFNESAFNVGLGFAANILVEAFLDSNYTDLVEATVPEPASTLLTFVALAGALTVRRRARSSGALAV